MQYHKQNKSFPFLPVAIILVLIILLFIWSPWSKLSSQDNQFNGSLQRINQTQSDLASKVITKPEPIPAVQVKQENVSTKGMCEDYTFVQGQKLSLDNYDVVVERISTNAIRLDVDGEKFVLGEGFDIYSKSGLDIELQPNHIIYFTLDDSENAVTLRIGCKRGENPKDKYVRERGLTICNTICSTCKDSFDIK